MDTPHPKPLPCPNPECRSECSYHEYWDGDGGFVECTGSSRLREGACGYTGPSCNTQDEAIRLHNALCAASGIPIAPTGYYECHITIAPDILNETQAQPTKQVVEVFGWKFSQIKGDPVLGDKLLQYATKHYPGDKEQFMIENEMQHAVLGMQQHGLRIVRSKIELVVYDSKEKANDR